MDRLSDLKRFGSNPGNLRARIYIPNGLPSGAPLVVVLHGCTQTAADYDYGSGWSYLADRFGFALLFPEQQRSNNPKLCFNWFVPAHIHRGGGEPFSISQMIERLAADIDVDRHRIFITGLSAGGAMTSVMLATFPDLFRGGAIIAGLPYACAATVPEALDRMHGRAGPQGQDLDARIRDATPYAGPWPAISIWHGSADETVVPANSEAILRQWLLVHALEKTPTRTELVDGYAHRVWCDSNGRELIDHRHGPWHAAFNERKPRLRQQRPLYVGIKYFFYTAHSRILGAGFIGGRSCGSPAIERPARIVLPKQWRVRN